MAPSLPRIADTWCSTVLTEMNNLAEISSLDWPSDKKVEDLLLACRQTLAGAPSSPVRAPAGMERMPRSRIVRRTTRAAASAPRSVSRASDSRSRASSLVSSNASAAS